MPELEVVQASSPAATCSRRIARAAWLPHRAVGPAPSVLAMIGLGTLAEAAQAALPF